MVSVSLRGLWFLSKSTKTKNSSGFNRVFPSPYGDCGSYQVWVETLMIFMPSQFPSPYGDCGSYRNGRYNKVWLVCRFRPLTGIVVLIESIWGGMCEFQKGVSVPLRGLWFLSEEKGRYHY